MPEKIILFDVPHLFFRAFFAIPRNLTDGKGTPLNAVYGVSSIILSIIESDHPRYLFGARDEKAKTHRHEKVPDYKGHRPEMPDELVQQLPLIKDLFDAFHIPVFSEEGYEADDFLATISEKYRGNPEYEIEIVTGDQDMFQLIGDNVHVSFPQLGGKKMAHFDRTAVFTKLEVYPEQIADYKAMVGDSSDNLKGIPGIGKKTAVKLLSEYGTLHRIIENAEKIPGAVGKKIREGVPIALLTKEMTTLHRDLSLDNFSLESGDVRSLPLENLEKFFRKYYFHSLVNRLQRIFGSGEKQKIAGEEEELWAEIEASKRPAFSEKIKKSTDEDQMALF